MASNKKTKTQTIYGILELFVVVSIGYMGYLTVLGTDGIAPKVMTVPALLFGAVVLVRKFTK